VSARLSPTERYLRQRALAKAAQFGTPRHLSALRRLVEASSYFGPDRAPACAYARYMLALELEVRKQMGESRAWALAAGTLELDAECPSAEIQSYVAQAWEQKDPVLARSFAKRAVDCAPVNGAASVCYRLILGRIALRLRDKEELRVQVNQIELTLAQLRVGSRARVEIEEHLTKFRKALTDPPRSLEM
jgi:hypothetical protein